MKTASLWRVVGFRVIYIVIDRADRTLLCVPH